jgi:hypothetical protein
MGQDNDRGDRAQCAVNQEPAVEPEPLESEQLDDD